MIWPMPYVWHSMLHGPLERSCWHQRVPVLTCLLTMRNEEGHSSQKLVVFKLRKIKLDHESSAVISWASAVESKPLGTQAAPVCEASVFTLGAG